MSRPSPRVRSCRAQIQARAGFTLLELMLVMAMIGILFGIGTLGLERIDPGARGLEQSLSTFLESSRDRARASGFPVAVEVLIPDNDDDLPRIVRHSYRVVLESNFEAAFRAEQGVTLLEPASLGAPGRCGGCLSMSAGGSAVLAGRGGRFEAPGGLAIDFDLYVDEVQAGQVLGWEGLLALRLTRDGGLEMSGELLSDATGERMTTSVATGGGAVAPKQWHHVQVLYAGGRMAISVDGGLLAEEEFGGRLPAAEADLLAGDVNSRFHGRIDELVVRARVRELGPKLREGVVVAFSDPVVVFDRHGLLDRVEHAKEVDVDIYEFDEPAGKFRVGRFAEEVRL